MRYRILLEHGDETNGHLPDIGSYSICHDFGKYHSHDMDVFNL